MAEIAIPLLALGGLYVISNQKKDKQFNNNSCLENFTDSNSSTKLVQNNFSKDGNVANSNFTAEQTDTKLIQGGQKASKFLFENKEYKLSTNDFDNTYVKHNNSYENPNQHTDKFFNKNTHSMVENRNGLDVYSLTGDKIDPNNFKHNNMVPFFGGKIRGSSNDGLVDSRLDSMQGSGSLQVSKSEQAPLFQPHNNLQHVNGTPNVSDFLQSRVNPSMKMSNVVPWKQEQVAPGLNKGFNTEGGLGFNSGMESREQWQPKTVDDLRVKTNPKQTFSLNGHQGPLMNPIQNVPTTQNQGKVEKHGPDTYYTVGPQRWFTTTGDEKAQTSRSNQVMQNQNRIDTTREYYGNSNYDSATYVKGEVQESRKPVLASTDIPSLYAPGAQSVNKTDYGMDSYNILPNARTTSEQPDNIGGIYGMARSVVAPLLDVFKPTKKENVVGNVRLSGNVQTEVEAGHVYNPADRTKTTIRETTKEKNHLYMQNQDTKGYLVNPQQSIDNNRMNTSIDYTGNANCNTASRTYNAEYKQRNNVNKNTIERTNGGCNQVFNHNQNISMGRNETDRQNHRTFAPEPRFNTVPSLDTYGKINSSQNYDNTMNAERMNPDILTAFKNNPYTQSLGSY